MRFCCCCNRLLPVWCYAFIFYGCPYASVGLLLVRVYYSIDNDIVIRHRGVILMGHFALKMHPLVPGPVQLNRYRLHGTNVREYGRALYMTIHVSMSLDVHKMCEEHFTPINIACHRAMHALHSPIASRGEPSHRTIHFAPICLR